MRSLPGKKQDDIFRYARADPRHSGQLLLGRLADLVQRAKLFHQLVCGRAPHAVDLLQGRGQRRRLLLVVLIRNGEAMHLLLNLVDQGERALVRGDRDLAAVPRNGARLVLCLLYTSRCV